MDRASRLALPYFAAVSAAFALAVPPFEGPDEPAHLAYINHVARTGRLTNQRVEAEAVVGEGHQPPLYYAACAALLRLGRRDRAIAFELAMNPRHVWNGGPTYTTPLFRHDRAHPIFRRPADRALFYGFRLLSVALGTWNLAVIARLARRLAPDARAAPAAVAFAATLPQFLFICGMINSDNLANLLSTLAIALAYAILDDPRRPGPYLLLGAVVGLDLLTKKTALVLLPGILAVLLLGLVRGGMNKRSQILAILASILVAVALSGWLFARNYRLYGDVLGTRMERETLPALVVEKSLASPYFRAEFPRLLFRSFQGTFGWANVALPAPYYAVAGLAMGLGGLGLLLRAREEGGIDARTGLALVFVLSCVGGIVHYNLTYTQPQGRFLFPVLFPIAWLLGRGWSWWLSKVRPEAARARLIASLVGALVLVDLGSLVRIVLVYAR